TRVSIAIKYLTQSTWSHAALYVGRRVGRSNGSGEALALIEADVIEGVRAVPVSMYADLHTRICRPVGLTPREIDQVMDFAIGCLGHQYDLKNLFDLARYMLPLPPVPTRSRRHLLALGSGQPTQAICSTLIAQAFHSVRYPILPYIEYRPPETPARNRFIREVLYARHHSLFTPRDFDISPYFWIVKPRIEEGFDPKAIRWGDAEEERALALGAGMLAPGASTNASEIPGRAAQTEDARPAEPGTRARGGS
ncbi:MAG TPA: hypothetical protein VFR86_07375, partial [Burkholderiaceae bacterium]|nr:hypothetical protein [Burkholderiaceae bacterium]